MNDALSPTAPAFRPFGDVLVCQMDAAPLADERMALFAATVGAFGRPSVG